MNVIRGAAKGIASARFISSTTVAGDKFGKSNWGVKGRENRRQQDNSFRRRSDINGRHNRKKIANNIDYDKCVDSFFEKVYKGILPMININNGFTVERKTLFDSEKLFVVNLGKDCDHVTLTLQTVKENCTLDYFSPANGKLVYSYCEDTLTFRNIDDDHDLLGIFARDLIKDAKGFPQF